MQPFWSILKNQYVMLSITQYFGTDRQSSTIFICMFFMLSSDKNARSSCQHSSYVYNKKNNLWDITRYTFAMQFICIQQYFISLVLLLVWNYLLSILQLVNCTKHEIQTNVNLIWSFIQFVIKVIEEPKRYDELIIITN